MSLFHFFFICLLAVTLQNEVSEIQWDEKTFELQTKIALLDTNPLLAPEPGTRLQITANRLNIRATPTTSARILTTLNGGDWVDFTGEIQRADNILWYGVQKPSFGKGFASSEYLQVQSANPGRAVANWALQQVGKGYTQRQCPAQCCRLGPNCFDCSGLTYVGWKRAGYTIPLSTHGYNTNTLQRVTWAQMRPGDMLWRTGHVGMFVGNGVIVEAANPTKGVIRSNANNFKYTYIYRPKNTLNVTAIHH